MGQKSTVIENLETILEQTVICADEELAELDEKIKAVQLELVDRATSSEGYEDLARESDRLNEEKQKILITLAEDKGRQEKKAELIDFLHEQTTEFDEFDDGLVRRLIELCPDEPAYLFLDHCLCLKILCKSDPGTIIPDTACLALVIPEPVDADCS